MRRASGILLHITSLPSNFGIGDLGKWAYKFSNLLLEIKQSYWQILPLNPTSIEHGNSPYFSNSGFAGNPLLISPDLLINEKLLPNSFDKKSINLPSKYVDYKAVSKIKGMILMKAYKFFKDRKDYNGFEKFSIENSKWLDDYALYKALKRKFNKPWYLWPSDLRDRDKSALNEERKALKDFIDFEKFTQFLFFKQWFSLKKYCNEKGLKIIGDIPFYVSHDSADVWVNPEIFKLDKNKMPLFLSGVPPDYFSNKGQLWGTPVYNWDELERRNFEWWIERIKHNLKLFDLLRLDHFRGFLAYWEVPAYCDTAEKGKWIKTPSEEFFSKLIKQFPNLPFIAEDLGFITLDVEEAISKLGIPNMKVLLFAFSNSNSSHLPHNHSKNSVVFTSTHDTNTVKGWFLNEATQEEKDRLFKYVGKKLSERTVSWEFIRLSMISVANLSITPMQDILSLGSEARMNKPSSLSNNWEWRLTIEQLISNKLQRFKELTEIFGRAKS
ncbi:MAG: 4-alpha-glucanotransferase [Nitrososphaerales archaeon]